MNNYTPWKFAKVFLACYPKVCQMLNLLKVNKFVVQHECVEMEDHLLSLQNIRQWYFLFSQSHIHRYVCIKQSLVELTIPLFSWQCITDFHFSPELCRRVLSCLYNCASYKLYQQTKREGLRLVLWMKCFFLWNVLPFSAPI